MSLPHLLRPSGTSDAVRHRKKKRISRFSTAPGWKVELVEVGRAGVVSRCRRCNPSSSLLNRLHSLPSSKATGLHANHSHEMELVLTCPSSVDLAFSWTAGIMRVRWFAKVHHVTNQWRYHSGVCWSKPVPSSQYREVQRRCVNKSLSVVQLRGLLTGTEFPSRTHLHHKNSGTPLEQELSHSSGITDQQMVQAGARMRRLSHKGMLCSPSRFLRNHGPESGDTSYFDVRPLCSVPAYRELFQESMRKHFVGYFRTAKLRKTRASLARRC